MTLLALSTLLYAVGYVVIILLALEWWRLRGRGAVTVLQEFRLSLEPDAKQVILVRGRRSGVLAWLLTLLRIEGEDVLRVSQYDLTLERSSLYGFESTYVPLRDVASASCAYYRAFSFLILSMLMLVQGPLLFLLAWYATIDLPYQRQQAYAGLVPTISGGLALSALLYVVYVLSKRIYISVESTGGERVGLSFKRSVIENVTIELNQGLELIEILNNKVLQLAGASR